MTLKILFTPVKKVVRMPVPINQLSYDESIALLILFLDVYTRN